MKRLNKFTVRKTLLSTFIVLFSMVSFSTTYYVSNTGSDANSGLTSTLPWRTIAKVNGTIFKAGDLVLFQKGGTWAETLTISSSGSAGNPVIYGVYGKGNKPVITGSDTRAFTINTNNKIFITIDGLNLVHALGTNYQASVFVGGIMVQDVTIKNCTIENNRRSGIILKGLITATNVKVDSCIIQNNGQFGILVTAGYTSGQISNCKLLSNGWASDIDNSQISNIQGNLGNLNIFGNTIYNAAPSATDATKSHGIYFSTPNTNPVNIYNNIVYGNLKGAGIKTRYSANVYNNTIYGNKIEGINLGGNGTTNAVYNIHNNIIYGSVSGFPGIFEIDKGLGTLTSDIYNNTFYKSGTAYQSTKELSISDNLTVLIVRNNIFYAANGHGGISIATQSNAIIDNNLYWKDTESGEPDNIYNQTTYHTLAKWIEIGFDTHSINSNPCLKNPTSDFQIASTSPAINAGVNVGLIKDYYGNSIVGFPDIGACESVNSTDRQQ